MKAKASGIFLAITAIVFLVAVSLSCASRKSEPVQQKEFVIKDESIREGRHHFMHFCQKCHPGGEAGLGPSINANPAPVFLKKFQVRHGLGVMPGFSKEVISKKELKEIGQYLKKLKQF